MLWWVVLFATAVALGWGLGRVWRIAAVGSAYRSKILCSIVFGTGRTVDPQRVDDVSADLYRLMRLFRSRVDPVAGTVTTSLFGLWPRTATYRDGLGATLFLRGGSADLKVGPSTASLKARTTSKTVEDRIVRPSSPLQL